MTEKRVISEPFTWSKESELESRLKEAEEVIKELKEMLSYSYYFCGRVIKDFKLVYKNSRANYISETYKHEYKRIVEEYKLYSNSKQKEN